jgi:hypothetical protein
MSSLQVATIGLGFSLHACMVLQPEAATLHFAQVRAALLACAMHVAEASHQAERGCAITDKVVFVETSG